MATTTTTRPKKTDKDDDRPAIWVGYGRLVKLFREKAGLTQQQLAEAIGYSPELVAKVEQGRRPTKASFTEAAERALDAGGALQVLQESVDLARLPAFFQDFASLELGAVSFFWYGGYVVPGLLQTEAYARALLTAHFPPLREEIIEERVSARMDRQGLLTRDKPPVVGVFLIEEAVLHRPVGSSSVMKAQLERLLEQAQLRNVEVQVMPTSFGAHSGLNGSMVLLETAEHRKLAYIESQDASTVVSEPAKVSEFWLRYGMLRSQALNIEESARLIARMAGEL